MPANSLISPGEIDSPDFCELDKLKFTKNVLFGQLEH